MSETGDRRIQGEAFEPVLEDACNTIWDEWHSLAQQRAQAQQHLPEYICFDAITGAEVTLAQFTSAVENMTAGALAKGNEVATSSYCMRRVPPRTLAYEMQPGTTGLHWQAGGEANAASLMPWRYSGEKFSEELKSLRHPSKDDSAVGGRSGKMGGT